jgi:tight adherence protein C
MNDPNNLPLIAAVLVFASILLLFIGMASYHSYRHKRLRFFQKVRTDAGGRGSDGMAVAALATADAVREQPVAKLLAAVGEQLQPANAVELKRRNLDFLRAGIRRSNALAVFWGAKCFLALALAGGFLLIKPFSFRLLLTPHTLLISMVLVCVGFYLPDIWLRLRISRRKRNIQDGLPDALDLLVVCVEAGMSLDAAIHRVGEEIRFENKDLSDELVLMNLEIRAGKQRRDAMKNLALRTDLEDINSLVTLLVQTDQLGTSIAQALRVFSDSFRTKRMQRAEEIAAKLPVKLMLPLGLFIFPCIFVVLLGPAAIQIFRVLIQK